MVLCKSCQKLKRFIHSGVCENLGIFCIKNFKSISKKTIALVWFYLQINGKPNEKLIDELIGAFDRNHFNRALLWLMLHDEEEMDTTAVQMKQLISKHFQNENEISDWSKDIFKQVAIIFQRIRFKLTSACVIHSKRLPLCVNCSSG